MNHPIVKLNEICRPKQWKTIAASALLEDGYPVYGANGKIGFFSEFTHESPTLMITCRGATCGNVHISEPKSYINGNAMALDDLDLSRVDIKYLYYFFKKRGFNDVISGSAQPQITGQGLTKVTVPLPPLKEQQRIAAILDKADAIRRKRQQAIALADEFLRAVFLDMFGDPVTNPKGWRKKQCSEISRQITVGLVIKPASYYVEHGIPAIRSLNIKSSGIDKNNFVFFSKEDNEQRLAKSRVFAGDIVIVRSGQPGKAAVVPQDLDGVNAIDVLILRPDGSFIDPDYFAYFLNSGAGKRLVMAEGRGQIQQHLNVGSLNQAAVPVPPLDLQRRFVSVLKNIRRMFTIRNESDDTDLTSAISQRAFSGQL
ncbi:restriction endonuclease subunit S [Microbulbifer pacificus]|uniref:Restriction endonuclease subunit S n=1 Tax=Microbulbifer pacificus TaxID=407164 RepID=A0AAU0MZN7_9GAMM|nr:restriction endonuclease subunit S [Microbulbifer pacificus]WOX05963.1 restriction endonuclease subunit S [Microbulbifer pacificus]